MEIKTLVVGKLQTNCYIISNNNECLIVDPGDDYDYIIKNIDGMRLLGVLITHYHYDHIGALEKILNEYSVKVYDSKLKHKNINISNFNFEIIYNPGHKEDCVSFYFEKEELLFSGDFIFKNTIGRTDLDGGDYSDMIKSIEMIKKYPNDTIIYPGHGLATNLGYEVEYNEYFKI